MQVLTIEQYLKLPEMVVEYSGVLNKALHNLNKRNRKTVVDIEFIDKKIGEFCSLMILMLDFKIKIPNLERFKIEEVSDYHSLKVRTNYEVFNLLVSEDLPNLYEELKSIC